MRSRTGALSLQSLDRGQCYISQLSDDGNRSLTGVTVYSEAPPSMQAIHTPSDSGYMEQSFLFVWKVQ